MMDFSKKMKQRELEAKLFFKNYDADGEDQSHTNEGFDHKENIIIDVDACKDSNKTQVSVNEQLEDIKIHNMDIETGTSIQNNEDYLDELVGSGRINLINKEIPTLTGDNIIDLESDLPSMISGAEELFDRFIKQSTKHKPRKFEQLE